MENPRNYLISDVELRWARLAKPVNPFGQEQYELQIVVPADRAEDLKANHLNVKEKDGEFVVSLKRKAQKADGSDNGKVRVVNADKSPMENAGAIGNGSRGNVIVFQYPYEAMGRKGIASSLTAVQVVELVEYRSDNAIDFDVIGDAPAASEGSSDLF